MVANVSLVPTSPLAASHSQLITTSVRGTFMEKTHDELDLIIMGQITAHCFQSPSATSDSASTSPVEKKEVHNAMKFFHQGHRVCQQTFLFLHTIGIKRFKNIKASYLQNGPAARVHGNKGRKPKKTLTLQEVKDVVQFILNYAGITKHSRIIRQSLPCIHTEANAMVLPGRIPGYKSADIQLLPSNTTKRHVWELYQEAATESSMRPVGYSTFTGLWKQLLPYIVVMKPMTDLCWQCQRNGTAISKSSTHPIEEKKMVCILNACVCVCIMDVCTYMYMCIHMHLPNCACAGEEIEIERGKEREREREHTFTRLRHHFRSFVKLNSTWKKSPKSAPCTSQLLTLPKNPSGSSSLLMVSLVLHSLHANHNPAQGLSRLTTLSTWPSRYSTPMTPNRLGPCTSLPQESVPSLEYAVRLSHGKSIT